MMKTSFIIKSIAAWLITAQFCYAQPINPLLPDYVSMQYAGSTGWLSVGTGYHLFKDHFRAGVQYGYVPDRGTDLHILTVALLYKPFKMSFSDKVSINPIDFGLKASYQIGKNYNLNWPSKYPDGYYWWNSALRLHLVTESSITIKLARPKPFKSVTGFIELNTNDLYMISYVLNMKSLKLTEVVKMGVGVRLQF